MKNALILMVVMPFLACCASKRNTFTDLSYKVVNDYHLQQKIYQTKNFSIFTLQRISNPDKPLRIYIEGDGRAYIDKYTPSFNPTPVSEFLLDIISNDDSSNVVYIARPCQYVDSKNCQEEYWTNKRFSPEIIESMNEVVNKFSNYQLELVGYSGGATIINHLHSKNIKNIRTIAGNLDVKKFTNIHKISELEEPEVNYKNLAEIPQIHFVGNEDKIITADVFNSYKKHLPSNNCVKMVTVKYASHYKGWENRWHNLLKIKPPICGMTFNLNSVTSKLIKNKLLESNSF